MEAAKFNYLAPKTGRHHVATLTLDLVLVSLITATAKYWLSGGRIGNFKSTIQGLINSDNLRQYLNVAAQCFVGVQGVRGLVGAVTTSSLYKDNQEANKRIKVKTDAETALKAKHKLEMDALKLTAKTDAETALKAKHKLEMDALKLKTKTDAETALKAKHKLEMDALKLKTKTDAETALKAKHLGEMNTLKQTAKTTADGELEKLKQAHNKQIETLTDAKTTADDELAKLKLAHKQEIETLTAAKTTADGELEKLKQAHNKSEILLSDLRTIMNLGNGNSPRRLNRTKKANVFNQLAQKLRLPKKSKQ